ncbi:MAG: LON peptidase substrate-binding domain-containing protein [Aestuariivita sp.]|nr:LON peptidase substrate-binding domain-containing protein [Aestuariivita sp.]
MITSADLPKTLAVFPLPGALLLPRSRLPLHIFEPRYIQMLEDSLKTGNRLIGMIQPQTVKNETDALYSTGCAGRITQFSETDDGRFLITLSGLSRFRVIQEIVGFVPYRKCEVTWSEFNRDLGPCENTDTIDRFALLKLLKKFSVARGMKANWDALNDADNEVLVNSLSMILDFNPCDKQALLEAPGIADRYANLVTLMEFSLRTMDESETLQ